MSDHITQPVNMVDDECNHVWSDPDIMDEGEYQVKISVCIHSAGQS
jgi:hypothetical protein